MNPRANMLLAACATIWSGCIASNVVANDERLVQQPTRDLAFAPAPALQLDGLYESTEITGEAALSLRRIYYLFRGDGTYTAAALVEQPGGASFQTIDGTWVSSDAGLSLDGAEPVLLERSGAFVRITASTGSLLLRRSVLQ